MADPSRVDLALHLFAYREVSAEEWAARWSHTVGCSSFDNYRYPDPALTVWIDELHRLFGLAAELERCRRAYLTPAEYAAVQADIAETLEHGL